ncbi:MAG: hypothetical protein ACQER7_03765 [Bacteroidota bacterium]
MPNNKNVETKNHFPEEAQTSATEVQTLQCNVSTAKGFSTAKRQLQDKYTELQRRNFDGYFTDHLERLRIKINQIDNQQKQYV